MEPSELPTTSKRSSFAHGRARKQIAAATSGILVALVLTGTGAASASPARTASASSCVPVTFWAWVPGLGRAVTAFNKSHPGICVKQDDVGAGNPEYVKLAEALKSGKGAPDVAEVEYDELPSFEITNNVVNIAKYGANNYKKDFATWAWDEVSQGSAVYAMPGDAGPEGFYYNSVQLAKYGIKPPTTWAQFAADAATFHKDDPTGYFSDFAAADLQWMLSLLSQDGAFPFTYKGGADVTIDFTGMKQMAFAAYWQKMLSAKDLNATTDVSAVQFGDMDAGTDASFLSSAWFPSYFAPDVKKTTGDWRATAMPQWTAGANVAANWGGSSYPVFSTSQHPAQAAEFSEWLNSTNASWNIIKTAPSSLFPTYKPLLNSASFTNITVPVSGSSHPDVAFAAAGKNAVGVSWPPFMTEALTLSGTTFAPVLNGTGTLQKAFTAFQGQLVKYARSEGFKVTT